MKNLVHVPCQMAIQDQISGHSLIAIFHEIKLQFPGGAEIPLNAVIPREWAIFSKWELEVDEEGRDYVSTTEIYWPDGTLFARFELKAANPIANGMAFVVRLSGFPMGQIGIIRVTNTLSEGGRLVSGPNEIAIRVYHQFDLPAPPLQ